MPETPIVEITEFRLVDAVDEETLREASDAIRADLESLPGFVRRELLRGPDGSWVDLVWWESRDAAESAVDAVMATATFERYFSLIDDDSIRMRHFETAETHAAA